MQQNSFYRNKFPKISCKCRWENISHTGSKSVVLLSSIWVFLVPITAKFLHRTETMLNFEIFDQRINIDLNMSTSFYIFYFSSVLFSVGGIVYNIYCPSIIKNYKSFKDYYEKEKSAWKLKMLVIRDKSKTKDKILEDVDVSYFILNYCNIESEQLLASKKGWAKKIEEAELKDNKLSEAFAVMKDLVDEDRFLARFFCMTFYNLGLSMLGLVFIMNFIYVVKFMFGTA